MENLFKLNSNENLTKIDAKYMKILLEPWYYYCEDNKGTNFHKICIQVYNDWLKLNEMEFELVMDFFKWLHTTLILIDDMQDSSELRRGNPAAYILYGVGSTIAAIDIVCVNFLFNGNLKIPTEVMQDSYNTEIFQTMELNYCLQQILQGQTTEIYWRDNCICPSEEHYFLILYQKTGYSLLAVTNYMQVFSKVKINITKLSILLGLYIQLTDDFRGLNSKLIYDSKGFCDDIREGKFTISFIHGINSRPNDKRLMGILKMHTDDIDLKKKCLELLEEFGSLEYAKNKVSYYQTLMKQEIDHLGLDDSKFKILYKLHNYDH